MSSNVSANFPVATVRKRRRTTRHPESGLIDFLLVDASQNAKVSVSAALNAITARLQLIILYGSLVERCLHRTFLQPASRTMLRPQSLLMRSSRGSNVTTRDRLAFPRSWAQNGGPPR